MASKIKKMEGSSLTDCEMIVIEFDDGSDGIAFTSASKLGGWSYTPERSRPDNGSTGRLPASPQGTACSYVFLRPG